MSDATKPIAHEHKHPVYRIESEYKCPECEHVWVGHWHCACEDQCPECGEFEVAPFNNEEVLTQADVDQLATNFARYELSCPYCGSRNIDDTGEDYDHRTIYDSHVCNDCQGKWTLVHELTRIQADFTNNEGKLVTLTSNIPDTGLYRLSKDEIEVIVEALQIHRARPYIDDKDLDKQILALCERLNTT